jgi:hypothetical protein
MPRFLLVVDTDGIDFKGRSHVDGGFRLVGRRSRSGRKVVDFTFSADLISDALGGELVLIGEHGLELSKIDELLDRLRG